MGFTCPMIWRHGPGKSRGSQTLSFPWPAPPLQSPSRTGVPYQPSAHAIPPRIHDYDTDAGLYDAPIWMLCCYALSQLPGKKGSLAEIHATLTALLSGHVVLPWVNQLHKYLATSSLDGRGIQKLVGSGACPV